MSTTNILDLNNRIDELEKNSGGGDNVVANPTGETTATLTSIEIAGVKYAVGGGGGTMYLDHGKIGQADPAQYITNCPLDENLTAGKAIAITITDGQDVYSAVQYYAGGTVIYNIGGFSLYVYSDHVGLPNYSGSYRDIYCDIVGI